ncbi:uncharacterized protein LOC143027398 [Oratosquilla oratoria]|uniref:uncharacterized protein LOC143027398 n=1 Tax=Oratosquilla oratoria TaxID=337810 RepID=UPI003F771827
MRSPTRFSAVFRVVPQFSRVLKRAKYFKPIRDCYRTLLGTGIIAEFLRMKSSPWELHSQIKENSRDVQFTPGHDIFKQLSSLSSTPLQAALLFKHLSSSSTSPLQAVLLFKQLSPRSSSTPLQAALLSKQQSSPSFKFPFPLSGVEVDCLHGRRDRNVGFWGSGRYLRRAYVVCLISPSRRLTNIRGCVPSHACILLEDVDGYFKIFEAIALKQVWPKDDWLTILTPKLTGKALQVYNSLDRPDDYDFVKKQVLHAYAQTPDGYRQKFRSLTKSHAQTYVEFASEKLRQCKKWLEAIDVTTFSKLLNTIVLEEWKSKIPFHILRYVEDRREKDLIQAVELADAQALMIETWGSETRWQSPIVRSSSGYRPEGAGGKVGSNINYNRISQPVQCSYCKKTGHSIQECNHPGCKASSKFKDHSAKSKPIAASNVHNPHTSFDPYIFQGKVSLHKGGPNYPVTILRDTGAAQSILLSDVIPNISNAFTVQVAVRHGSLPIHGIKFLLGKDLADTLIVTPPRTVGEPLPASPTLELDESCPHLFPACAVTRSQRMRKDISNFIRTCHVCQAAGKPNQKIPKAPLKPIPISEEPFDKVLTELGIEHVTSSAYHPQSQGCVERYHQSLKAMLRKYCLDTGSSWDSNLDWILFSIIEANHENLRNKLQEVRLVSKAHFSQFQKKSKLEYDRTSKVRTFKVGDMVLAFLPPSTNSFHKKFFGPYKILEQQGPLNYIIETPDRGKKQQLVHINLIKRYLSRPPEEDTKTMPISIVNPVTLPKDEGTPTTDFPLPNSAFSNRETLHHLNKYLSGLHPSQKTQLISVIKRFPEITLDHPGLCNVFQHNIQLKDTNQVPIRQRPYPLNPEKTEILKKEVQYLLDHGLAEPSHSPWASPCLLVPKADNTFRMCTEYRKINNVTVRDAYPLPLIEQLLDMIGDAHFISTIDLLKGYYQVALTQEAKAISAFVTPFGLYQYRVMAFGLTNAPATFQRLINAVIQGLPGVGAYLDDVVVVADNWEDHLTRLEGLFHRLKEAGLVINLQKSVFARGTVTYLGHTVGGGSVRPKKANVEAILAFPTPRTMKEVMRFLGMAGYYRRFCKDFSTVAAPLTDLTSSAKSFQWSPSCQTSFENIKSFLTSEPVLKTPNYHLPFHLQIDASGVGVGAVLLQPDPTSTILHPVAFFSAKLNKHQENYSTIEKEALSLVLAIKKFRCYLQSSTTSIKIFTDHNPLAFIQKAKLQNQKILR